MVASLEGRSTARDNARSPRIINVVLGVWLFLSAFLWPHSQAQMTNTWIVGVLTVVFALGAMVVPMARYANTLAAVWLFVSAWALPTVSAGTVWNNVLVAIGIFVISLVPAGPMLRSPGSPGNLGRTPPPRPI